IITASQLAHLTASGLTFVSSNSDVIAWAFTDTDLAHVPALALSAPGGSVTFNGAVSLPSLSSIGITTSGTGAILINSATTLSSMTANAGWGVTIAAGKSLTVASGTVNAGAGCSSNGVGLN